MASEKQSKVILLQFLIDKMSLLNNYDQAIKAPPPFHGELYSVSTLDIKDLHYSLPYDLLIRRLRCILEKDLVAFKSSSGISVDVCLR